MAPKLNQVNMANSTFPLYFLAIFASLVLLSGCNSVPPLPENHAALFIFGDSLFDAGNNNYINTSTDVQANFWPYGETYFKFPTGRFSDGLLVPDFIAKFAKLPLIPPYLQPGRKHYVNGMNFASAGAGALVETNQGLVIGLNAQLNFFKKVEKLLRDRVGDAEAEALLSQAIYLINIGANDYIAPFFTESSIFKTHSREQYVDLVIGNLTAVIKEIHKKGGRKFGFLNVGVLGCTPSARALLSGGTGACNEEMTALARLHNKQLSKALLKLQAQLKGFLYSYADFHSYATDVLNNPAKYGFKEGKAACCGSGPFRGINSCGGKRVIKEYELCSSPREYVFFDFSHPSQKASQLFAQILWSGNPNVTWPLNLKSLFQMK